MADSSARTLVLGIGRSGEILQCGQNAPGVIGRAPEDLVGTEVSELFTVDGKEYPVGTFFVVSKATTRPLVEKLAADLGTPFVGVSRAPGTGDMRGAVSVALKPVRVGLWDRYGGSMPAGWTRMVLEQFEFPFQVVYPPQLDRGGLKEMFDVIVFVDGAMPGRGGAGGFRPKEKDRKDAIPEEYRGRLPQTRVTAEEIVRFAHDPRTQQVTMLEGDRYEVLDITTKPTSEYVGLRFRDMPIRGALIGAIVRDGRAVFPRSDEVLQAGDRVIVFTETARVAEVERVL